MHTVSRAGLLALVLVYVLSYALLIVSAAPISETPDISVAKRVNPTTTYLAKRPYPIARGIRNSVNTHYTRTSEELHPPVKIYARKNFFTSIKDGFQNAGKAIKKGVQNVGGAIKSAAKRVTGGVKNAVKKVVGGVANAAKKVVGGVKNVVKKVAGGIKSAVKKVAGGVKNAAQKVVGGVKNVVKKVAGGIKSAVKKVAGGVKNAVKKVVGGVTNVAKKVAGGVKNAAMKVAGGVKAAVRKVTGVAKTAASTVATDATIAAKGVETGVKSAAEFAKENGPQAAKVAKFGLKLLSTTSSVGSKVAKFVPVVGQPLSTALKVSGKVEDFASDAIPVSPDANLEKGLSILNTIEHPGGGLGEVLDNLKRDTGTKLVFRREVF